MDHEIALNVLIQTYADDDEAVEAIARLFRAKKFHFFGQERPKRMLERLAGKPAIVAALDDWLSRQGPLHAWEIAHVARLGGPVSPSRSSWSV